MTLAQEMTLLGQKAKEAARLLAKASPAAKNAALTRLAALLEEREAELRTANAQDLDAARARGLDAPRMDRLTLHPAVLADMRAACLHVAGLPDPVGAMDSQWQRPNGLLVGRMRVPLGVIAMIYEARPNVTIDAAILCLKAGNAVILRGGSEALHSNTALAALLRQALEEAGLPADVADDKLAALCHMFRERAGDLKALAESFRPLLVSADELAYDEKACAKNLTDASKAHLNAVAELFAACDPFDAPSLEAALHGYIEGNGLKFKDVAPALRTALMGFMGGPHLPEIMAFLGKDASLARIRRAAGM